MSYRIGPVVKEVKFTSHAQRDLDNLPPVARASFKKLLQEMKTGRYATGRYLKQTKGTRKNKPKVWQAKLGGSHRVRFTFAKKKGVATIQRMGFHHLFD